MARSIAYFTVTGKLTVDVDELPEGETESETADRIQAGLRELILDETYEDELSDLNVLVYVTRNP